MQEPFSDTRFSFIFVLISIEGICVFTVQEPP